MFLNFTYSYVKFHNIHLVMTYSGFILTYINKLYLLSIGLKSSVVSESLFDCWYRMPITTLPDDSHGLPVNLF